MKTDLFLKLLLVALLGLCWSTYDVGETIAQTVVLPLPAESVNVSMPTYALKEQYLDVVVTVVNTNTVATGTFDAQIHLWGGFGWGGYTYIDISQGTERYRTECGTPAAPSGCRFWWRGEVAPLSSATFNLRVNTGQYIGTFPFVQIFWGDDTEATINKSLTIVSQMPETPPPLEVWPEVISETLFSDLNYHATLTNNLDSEIHYMAILSPSSECLWGFDPRGMIAGKYSSPHWLTAKRECLGPEGYQGEWIIAQTTPPGTSFVATPVLTIPINLGFGNTVPQIPTPRTYVTYTVGGSPLVVDAVDGLLAGVADAEGDQLTVTLTMESHSGGQFNIDPSGSFTYTNSTAQQSFLDYAFYKVCDPWGCVEGREVQVWVEASTNYGIYLPIILTQH